MVDWSWELLTDAERVLLARLSVFAGGFGLPAAEAVAAGPDVPSGEVLGHLGALVDKSLVHFNDAGTGPGRYRLLETVRQYAAGRLDAQGSVAVETARMAHLGYYAALAEAAAAQLLGADQAQWLDRLDADLSNLRAAIAVGTTQSDPEPGLRLAASLRMYWLARGHAAEGADALRTLLDMPAAKQATLPRAQALATAASLLQTTGDYAIAGHYAEEAQTIASAAGDDFLVAELLSDRGWILARHGQPGAALPLIEQGLDLARRLGDPHLTARLLSARAYATNVQGDPAAAARDNSEALRLYRQAGGRLHVGTTLNNLSDYELWVGDLDAARRHLAEALDIARALNARTGVVIATFNLGLAEHLSGSPGAAETLFADSLDLARRMGMKRNAAYALIGLAMAGRGGTDPGWSARLHGAADQALADLGHTLQPLERRLADSDRQRLRRALGAEAFEAEYAAGRALDLTQVLAGLGRRETASGQAGETAPGKAVTVLTPRELDVLKLVAQGLSNPDIAQRLVLSEHTVHRHLANILRKLDLSSRAAAAAWGVRAGLL
jgi:DNA-binding CsgD family transcriptional regulator